MPIFYDQVLMFAVQLESDVPTVGTTVVGSVAPNGPSGATSMNRPSILNQMKSSAAQSLVNRSATISVRSRGTGTRMSDGVSGI